MSTPLTYFYKVKPAVLNLVSKSLLSEPQLPGPRHPPNTGSHCGATWKPASFSPHPEPCTREASPLSLLNSLSPLSLQSLMLH